MTQFYVAREDIDKERIRISGDEVRHLTNVLRKKTGDEIDVFDGTGAVYRVKIEKIQREFIETRIISRSSPPERKSKIHLFPAVLKNPRMDYLIQKVVELGVDEITPLVTGNTVVELDPQNAQSKVSRWQKIALSAAKQCGGAKIPVINLPLDFSQALEKTRSTETSLIFWEKEKNNSLRNFFSTIHYPPATINLFVGPEGGFSDEEIRQTEKYNFFRASLGRRILRSETAAIVAAALVLYEFDQ